MSTEFDIFQWANNIDGIKKDLVVELFLFNKNYTPYTVRHNQALNVQINSLFMYDIINTVMLGAGCGMAVRDINHDEKDKMALRSIAIEAVGRAETIIHYIEECRKDIVEFDAAEHEFKRIKGIVAKYTNPADRTSFYVIKAIDKNKVITNRSAWDFNGGLFNAMQNEAALNIAPDNQVLIAGGMIFAFNLRKFELLFNYDYRKMQMAEAKGKLIDDKFRLNMPTIDQGIAFMASAYKGLVNKLATVNIDLMDQEKVIKTADELGIELMTSDQGEIILMDKHDINTFLNLLNDDYLSSDATGINYLAKTKKPMEE